MAASNNTPQTRVNRLRGLELAIESRDPAWDDTARIIERADAFANYLHTGPSAHPSATEDDAK